MMPLAIGAGAILILWMAQSANAAPVLPAGIAPPAGIRQPPADIARILSAVATSSGVDLNLLKAVSFVESRFNPSAINNLNPSNPSMGLFQVRPSPWLNYLGLGNNPNVLFDAMTNAEAGADVLNYFAGRGYRLPAQVDVYNLGEPQYNAGVRNDDYNAKVNGAYSWFQGQ